MSKKVSEYIKSQRKILNFGDEYPEFVIRKLSPFDFLDIKGLPLGYQIPEGIRIQKEVSEEIRQKEEVENLQLGKLMLLKAIVSPKIVEKEEDKKDEETLCITDIDVELLTKLIDAIMEFQGLKISDDMKEQLKFFREGQTETNIDRQNSEEIR